MTYATHYVDYGPGRSIALAIVCGNYYRVVKSFVFGGGSQLMPWARIPENCTICRCSETMVEPIIEIEPCGILGTSDNIK